MLFIVTMKRMSFSFMKKEFKKMIKNDCRCDRKEHTVNQIIKSQIGDRFKIA